MWRIRKAGAADGQDLEAGLNPGGQEDPDPSPIGLDPSLDLREGEVDPNLGQGLNQGTGHLLKLTDLSLDQDPSPGTGQSLDQDPNLEISPDPRAGQDPTRDPSQDQDPSLIRDQGLDQDPSQTRDQGLDQSPAPAQSKEKDPSLDPNQLRGHDQDQHHEETRDHALAALKTPTRRSKRSLTTTETVPDPGLQRKMEKLMMVLMNKYFLYCFPTIND